MKRTGPELVTYGISSEDAHGPIGLHIGSRIPVEIAISILAEMMAVRNGISPGDKIPRKGDIC